ncbi:hypothetical protein IVB33_19205 [Bradyrhizobium sp. 24]|uniref:hypothetical protein n=1 Tax=unclassified Bradyrhizobium TaxID=2631580 RepID=UPI001FFA82E4|nr:MULTISPECIES: hypothetical protein [unclassified Bradyrhizobium]MCK1302859.1 hypothetical protein [Bradyrhizobium sp. 37]MCK1379632.1 hypothetical protein [Bradyrhizobium sp. 24]MCK1769376.1 hypothetical protein [Bradyrhizobium sp. 134]
MNLTKEKLKGRALWKSGNGIKLDEAVAAGFQLPTDSPPTMAPRAMSVRRDSPRQAADNRRAGRS